MRGSIVRAVRASGYLFTGALTASSAGCSLLLICLGLSGTPFVAALLLPIMVQLNRRITGIERHRAGTALGRPVEAEYTALARPEDPRGVGSTPRRWMLMINRSATDSRTYRDALWVVLHAIIGPALGGLTLILWAWVLSTISLPLWWPVRPAGTDGVLLRGAALAPVAAAALIWIVPMFAAGQARMAASLLGPPARHRLVARVTELTRSRAEALEAHGAELHRIERDLHDGAQAQIVSVALLLGVAERQLDREPQQVATLVRQAREGAELALVELRHLVRGMYPPILADRGLEGAIGALAGRGPVLVTVEVCSGRLPAAVEAAAYFTVAEALTNISRHSGATHASVRVSRQHRILVIGVRDDGVGGADEQRGTGLRGIRRRVDAFDGRMELDSPPGGPTDLRVELPCES